jgi:RNA polymerase sigma-70 factor (ECF subfamily)
VSEHEAAIEQAYREHASRILAALVRLFGTHNWELAEDVLQEAFRRALVTWQESGVPENPAAWLMSAAKNQAVDAIRGQNTRRRFSEDLKSQLESGWTLSHTIEQEFEPTRIKDHQLRMIFMCVSDELLPENRLPLILRTLCGFSIPAICRALLLPEATVKKRLLRTRERLQGHAFEFPGPERLPHAMDTVHTVIYLLFNEGWNSSDEAAPLNLELCREAIHLATLLVEEPRVVNGDTLGLLALMQLHLARVETRFDAQNRSIPIDLQDRSRWQATQIEQARGWLQLASSAPAGASGRFLIEARIANEHGRATTFAETDWPAIAALYRELEDATGSPLAGLHRAVALGYAGDTSSALAMVQALRDSAPLRSSHLPLAVLAHLSALAGDERGARRYATESMELGGTAREQASMLEQIERLLGAAPRSA